MADAIAIGTAADVIKESIRAYADYAKCKEVEITERKRIAGIIEVLNKKIESEKEVILKYMENSFEERERLYVRIDKVIELSLERADHEMLKLALNSMLVIYNKNPMDGAPMNQDFLNESVNSMKRYLP